MHIALASVVTQYERNKKLKPEDVKNLMEWIEMQPHFPKVTELEVMLFLHACMYSQESSKNVLDIYYTCRTHCPEYFSNRIPDLTLQNHMNLVCFDFLPGTTPEGYRVIYVKLMDKNPSNFNFTEQIKLFCMTFDIFLLKQGISDGHMILLNMEFASLSHLARIPVMGVKKFLFYLQEAMPVRKKGVHFINVVPFIDKVMALIRPFLKKELLDMLYFHMDGLDSLYKDIPKYMLPKFLGGDIAITHEEMHENMKKELIAHSEYFKEDEKRRIDETKRPGKAKNAGDLFGVEGTFKKLDID